LSARRLSNITKCVFCQQKISCDQFGVLNSYEQKAQSLYQFNPFTVPIMLQIMRFCTSSHPPFIVTKSTAGVSLKRHQFISLEIHCLVFCYLSYQNEPYFQTEFSHSEYFATQLSTIEIYSNWYVTQLLYFCLRHR
jgi:hypothetical protein